MHQNYRLLNCACTNGCYNFSELVPALEGAQEGVQGLSLVLWFPLLVYLAFPLFSLPSPLPSLLPSPSIFLTLGAEVLVKMPHFIAHSLY